MIKSMTGFGRFELSDNNRKITVEVKAVNHRYLDLTIKMPKKFNIFEADIRNIIKDYAQRGKIDLFITYEDYTDKNYFVKYNKEIAEEYVKHLNAMASDFKLENDVRVSALSRYPEVLVMEEQPLDEEEWWSLLEKSIVGALKQFVDSREKEGEHLKSDMLQKLDYMLKCIDDIESRSPETVTEYRKKLEDKIKDLLVDIEINENRILTEVTIFADRICVDEETVRLKSHIESTKASLINGGNVGRKLDFIAQEMNREANTILSKANDLEISTKAIELKTEIEKIREQIQNIE